MQKRWDAVAWLGALALCAPVLRCQTAGWQPVSAMPDAVVRVILDPYTGARWLLELDPAHPGGPGRLVSAGRDAGQPAGGKKGAKPAARVLRAGDRLIVEEKTPLAEAWLVAVALTPAAAGDRIPVRLAIGGRVVRAVVLAPGRAVLAPEEGERQ